MAAALCAVACHMGGYRESKQSAKAGYKKTMDFFATFNLLFEPGEDFDLALVFGFKNRHNRNILG